MSRHSPTERIILGHRAWRLADAARLRAWCMGKGWMVILACDEEGATATARLLQGRCQRLRANRDTWRHMCEDRAICGICHDVLQQEPCDDFDRPWVLRQDWAQARTWAARWKAVAHRYRSRSRKAGEHNAYSLLRRVQAENEVARLQNALDSANERCNRIQADGNALAEQLHAWRQACQDHGIQPTPEALRAVLRRVDAACVAGADL